MSRRVALVLIAALCVGLLPAAALGTERRSGDFSPGAPGVGDPYFPLDGNGGYDTRHYLLDVAYDPETDVLDGTAVITARATQNLSSFNLDLVGLEVRDVTVNGRDATWNRDGGELTITPPRGLRKGRHFITVVRYDGIPETIEDLFGLSGFIHTDDGALVVGEPDVAATWYPVNDHPSDKAAYTFRITVPAGLEAVANGVLISNRTRRGQTTWVWNAREPMAPYLTTASIGEFDVRSYREDGIRYWDALDPDLFISPEPRTGEQFAYSQAASPSYKRLARTISVPDEGAELSFWVHRDTEPTWDFMFVEANTAGEDDWTTLPDLNGHTSQSTGNVCPYWLGLHPFLTHYQTDDGDGTCTPTGTTGQWHAATGASDGMEQWTVDLSDYAGSDVEVAITNAGDDIIALPGLFVDDVEVSTGEGSTSFEDDGDTFDGWTVPGPPEGSPPNENDWIAATAEDAPPTTGEIAEGSLARQPEIIDFLASMFGPYPFSAAGGIVDDADISFALENQTRPIYSKGFFTDPISGDSVVVHELAHQWFGDDVALEQWQHIWLNEGFATYAEWLWSEREGLESAQETFDNLAAIPADNEFWSVTIGDPGPDLLFDISIYFRGAMTLHALRLEVGDDAFFEILRRWAQSQSGGNATIDEFIELAERVSGQQLDALFEVWLFTPSKPDGIAPAIEPAPDTEPAPQEESAQLQLAPNPADVLTAGMRHRRR